MGNIRNVDAQECQNDENQKDGSYTVQDLRLILRPDQNFYLGEMTSSARGFADECGGTADKCSVSSSSDNHKSFTTFDGRGSITGIALVFIHRKRFSSDGRLIDLDESILCDDTSVSRNDCAFFDLNDITGDDFGGFDFEESAFSEGNCLKRKSLF